MSPVNFQASLAHARAAGHIGEAPLAKAPIAIEVAPVAPFNFSYTKIRLDTGETVWRWPQTTASPNARGDLLDIRV